MKRLTLAAILTMSCFPAFAAEGSPDPTQQALVQMLSEAQNREANALVQIYTLRAQVADLQKRVAASEAASKSAASAAPSVPAPATRSDRSKAPGESADMQR